MYDARAFDEKLHTLAFSPAMPIITSYIILLYMYVQYIMRKPIVGV